MSFFGDFEEAPRRKSIFYGAVRVVKKKENQANIGALMSDPKPDLLNRHVKVTQIEQTETLPKKQPPKQTSESLFPRTPSRRLTIATPGRKTCKVSVKPVVDDNDILRRQTPASRPKRPAPEDDEFQSPSKLLAALERMEELDDEVDDNDDMTLRRLTTSTKKEPVAAKPRTTLPMHQQPFSGQQLVDMMVKRCMNRDEMQCALRNALTLCEEIPPPLPPSPPGTPAPPLPAEPTEEQHEGVKRVTVVARGVKAFTTAQIRGAAVIPPQKKTAPRVDSRWK